jgi:hypothetical protein
MMGLVIPRTLRQGVIRYMGLRWDSPELSEVRALLPDSSNVQVRLDPLDISTIYVFDENTDKWVEGKLVEPVEARGFTLDQWAKVSRLRKRIQEEEDVEERAALAQAIKEIDDYVAAIKDGRDKSKAPKRMADYRKRTAWSAIHGSRRQKRLARIYRSANIGLEGDGAFIIGETGAGKTTAARIFTDTKFDELRALDPTGEWERPEVAGTDLRPIVHTTSTGKQRQIVVVSVNPRPRFNALLQDTALAMQVGLPKSFDFGDAMREITFAIKQQKVKMIIFDDVQHIIDGGMDEFGAADVFKFFLKSRVSVVCIRLPYAEGLGKVNKQLGRLVQQLYTVKPLRCSLGDFPELDEKGRIKGGETIEKTTFREFMEAIDRRAGPSSVLPFDEPSNLSYPDMALRIHQATGGYVGEIVKLIQKASELAIEDGSSRLTMQDFAQAHENRTSCSDEANWFKMPWPKFADRFGSRPAKADAATTEGEKKIEKHIKKRDRRVADVMAGRK